MSKHPVIWPDISFRPVNLISSPTIAYYKALAISNDFVENADRSDLQADSILTETKNVHQEENITGNYRVRPKYI